MDISTPSAREKELELIIRETLWMACRYAHGRQSYAVAMYNEAARKAMECGVVSWRSSNGEPLFAIDGSLSSTMSGLSDDEYVSVFPDWFGSDAIPNHCRSDFLLGRDSDELQASEPL